MNLPRESMPADLPIVTESQCGKISDAAKSVALYLYSSWVESLVPARHLKGEEAEGRGQLAEVECARVLSKKFRPHDLESAFTFHR